MRKEPLLTKLTGENIDEKTAKIGDEARLDISAIGFWNPGQRVFFDIRVFDHNAQRYMNNNLQKSFIRNEVEKKKHNERVLNVENASFTCCAPICNNLLQFVIPAPICNKLCPNL